MPTIRPGKGKKSRIDQDKNGRYKVTPIKSKAELERDKLLKIPDPFKM